MSESSSRAVRLFEGTDPNDLRTTEVKRPTLGPDELLVAVHAAAVNPVDVVNVRGLIPLTVFPRVPGRDFAGVVVDGPSELIGSEVWGTGGGDLGFVRDGSHARHLVLPCDGVVPKPAAMSFDEAGSAGLAYVAASMALDRAGTVSEGSTVLVTGAAGGVGSAVVSMAKARGARVIGAVLGADECRRVEKAGVDTAIDTRDHDLADAVADATRGLGADLAVDTVGAPLLNSVIAAMGFGGGICFLAARPETRVEFDPQAFYRRDLRLVGLNTTRMTVSEAASVLRPLVAAFERGDLRPPHVAQSHPLEEASTAYSTVQNGTAAGRVVLRPQQ